MTGGRSDGSAGSALDRRGLSQIGLDLAELSKRDTLTWERGGVDSFTDKVGVLLHSLWIVAVRSPYHRWPRGGVTGVGSRFTHSWNPMRAIFKWAS